MRALCLILCLIASAATGQSLPDPAGSALTVEDARALLAGGDPSPEPLLAACCKVCSKGKACGDSCISRDKQCHKGVGCACDG
jgi:hypothetical protein